MIIDITKQIIGSQHNQKNEILSEIIEWLHINLGEYYGYEADTSTKPYRYALGKGWRIIVYENPVQDQNMWNNRKLTWTIEIDNNDPIAELFILKFL